MIENWKDVVEFERYQVSDLGNIRAKEIVVKARNNSTLTRKSQMIKPALNGGGYPMVRLRNNKGGSNMKLVHRLVATAFVDNPNNYEAVNHIDCIRSNPKANNLEWCTDSFNNKYAYDFGNKEPSYKKVKLFTSEGILAHEFDSIKSACEFLGKKQSGYPQKAMTDGVMCYGFKWRYV